MSVAGRRAARPARNSARSRRLLRRSGELRDAHEATVDLSLGLKVKENLDLESEFKAYVPRIDRYAGRISRRAPWEPLPATNTELAVDLDGAGEQHAAEAGGMTISLERWKAGLDTSDWFADLPDGACPVPHWGFGVQGTVTLRYTDGQTEVSRPARPTTSVPATMPTSTSDAEFVEFTQADHTPGINTVDLEPRRQPELL